MKTPAAEVEITEAIVRSLLKAQHPNLSDLPLRLVNSGWDNVMFRLGNILAVRLPRRQIGADLIEKEQIWLPVLSKNITIRIPTPVRTGQPSTNYPWRWSIVPWVKGNCEYPTNLSKIGIQQLQTFLQQLHRPAPREAPVNPVRGVPLAAREKDVEARLHSLATLPYIDTLWKVWQRAKAAPPCQGDCWIHGDLHPKNILTESGKISAVIDWGDMARGDPATDLAAVWMMIESTAARRQLLDAMKVDVEVEVRSQGWAIYFGTLFLLVGQAEKSDFEAIGTATLQHIVEDSALLGMSTDNPESDP